MKKLLSLVLVLVLLASLVTACGSKQETAQTTTTPTEQKTEATQKPEEKQEAVSQAAPAPASTEIKRLKYSRGGDVTSFDLFNTSFIAPMIVTSRSTPMWSRSASLMRMRPCTSTSNVSDTRPIIDLRMTLIVQSFFFDV